MNTELTKIAAVIGSYGTSEQNTSLAAGKGGNITYYLFLASKQTDFSTEVKTVAIKDNSVVWNPEFVASSKISELRNALDEQAATLIGDFVSPVINNKVDSKFVSDATKNINVEQLLAGQNIDPNVSVTDKLFLAQEGVSFVASLLATDEKKARELFSPLAAFLSKFDTAIVIWSMTRHLGLDKIVQFGIDENKDVDVLFKRSSSVLMAS
jgi:hypothetical protein